MILEILKCYFVLIFYHVEYYLTPSGCFVDRILICMNDVDGVHDLVFFACEYSRTSLELPLYFLLGV